MTNTCSTIFDTPKFDTPMFRALGETLADLPLPACGEKSVADIVSNIELLSDKHIHLTLEFGYPVGFAGQALEEQVRESLKLVHGFEQVEVACRWFSPRSAAAEGDDASSNAVPGVKNIIAVASGKGGVGKSTTAVNLAIALAHEGASVGLLDADIYGPSQQQMLGVTGQRPQMRDQKTIIPIESHGVKMVSMGNLVTQNTPMVWRGPMVSGALQQLFRNVHWENIDYLIVDMPPGTGDIQITLSQTVSVSGSVIVTTPQDIALLDAIKGVEMFRKVSIPPLGVVENMSTHVCRQCGHEEAIFGQKGGERLAQDYDVELLGQLPLQMDIRLLADEGRPSVAADPESTVSQMYRHIARRMTARLWLESLAAEQVTSISITDD